jgi:hypothetical protein
MCDVLGRSGVLTVRFSDGAGFDVSGCWPVDSSIYHEDGRWCCTVEQYLGTDEKKKLFRPDSGVDIHEEDIASITDKITAEILYSKT